MQVVMLTSLAGLDIHSGDAVQCTEAIAQRMIGARFAREFSEFRDEGRPVKHMDGPRESDNQTQQPASENDEPSGLATVPVSVLLQVTGIKNEHVQSLQNDGLTNLALVDARSDAELQKLKHIGSKTVERIREAIALHGDDNGETNEETGPEVSGTEDEETTS